MILRKIRTVLTAPADERRLLLKAIALIALFRSTLELFSFRHAVRLMDRMARRKSAPRDAATPEDLARAIRLASGSMLRDRPCLPQALALHLLYRRRGIESRLRIGVKKDEHGKLVAHAWVQREDLVVIGALPDLHEYTVLPDILPSSPQTPTTR